MERRKRKLKDNVGSYKSDANARAPVPRGTWRVLAYKNVRKCLKRIPKKRKRWYFASGLARKPPFFSVFKSVNLVGKSDDTLTARRRRALV